MILKEPHVRDDYINTDTQEGDTVSAGLDYYKPTMSQLAYNIEPSAEVTFTFHNRGKQRLLDHLDPSVLADRLSDLRIKGWQIDELEYLAGLRLSNERPVFDESYLEYLEGASLPEVRLSRDPQRDDLAIDVSGPWALSTFWETIVMSEVNEAYFEGYLNNHDINADEVYSEGDRRLSEKIAILQANPDIKIADFGTRRHFSYKWQKYVLERLIKECPENLIGTSNVALAHATGIKPIGTFAHEVPMVYAGLADARGFNVRMSHGVMLDDWKDLYSEDLSVALTDTFTSDFFFEDFGKDRANEWRGVRQDSGDPYEFGEKLIAYYKNNGTDPLTKTVVFSDGLDIGTIVDLHSAFKSKIQVLFGWGTSLTNDMGIKPLNVVMKATTVRDTKSGQIAPTVKLSDDIGKHTGSPEQVYRYQKIFS
jgi:nicotinate phosphoribosyltransferase